MSARSPASRLGIALEAELQAICGHGYRPIAHNAGPRVDPHHNRGAPLMAARESASGGLLLRVRFIL